MSYDIRLKDPVTEETAEVPGHLMIGGTYKADYHPETGRFTPALNTEAWLNITYNYGCYYYEFHKEKGIRCIYGLCGLDSIAILNDMIAFLEDKYKRNGEWIYTKREKKIFYDENGEEIEKPIEALLNKIPCTSKTVEVERYEGHSDNYWESTAANAIKPLYQLMCLAKMRPDCVWDGD